MYIAVGTYVGNGTSQSVAVSFQPDLVWVWDQQTWGWFCKTTAFTSNNSIDIFAAATQVTNGITALTSTGFSVGSATRVNTSGNSYSWLALKSTSDFSTGTYAGNGSDDRDISGVGFQAEVVFSVSIDDAVSPAGAVYWLKALADDVGNDEASILNSAGTWTTNILQGVGSDTFQIGSDVRVNRAATNYVWWAFKQNTSNFRTGKYTGNATDSRDIKINGTFPPWFVFTKVQTGAGALGAIRPAGLTGDSSFEFSAGLLTDRIQALNADGFQVGTQASVNSNTQTYYYFVFRGTAGGAFDALPALDGSVTAGGPGILPIAPYARYKNLRAATQIYNNLVIGE